jgi:plastocyanin
MHRLAMFASIAALTIVLAACGGTATQPPAASVPAAPTPAASAPAASSGGGAGASGGGGALSCATAAAGATAATTVQIKNFAYSQQSVQVKVGDVVAWMNGDSAPHSATMDDGSCDTDSISSGSTAMLVFNAPGTYTYHCKIHPTQMKDVTVVVQ